MSKLSHLENLAEIETLRKSLIAYTKAKFYSRRSIAESAEDIVDEAFAEMLCRGGGDSEKLNFGYLSTVCVHIAYRMFKRMDADGKLCKQYEAMTDLVDEKSVVDEIIKSDDAAEVLMSLEVLKRIERIIVLQRYYGDYSFNEIAEANGLKLNTVLSHHRRALDKLRSRLSMFAQDRSKVTVHSTRAAMNGTFSKNFNE